MPRKRSKAAPRSTLPSLDLSRLRKMGLVLLLGAALLVTLSLGQYVTQRAGWLNEDGSGLPAVGTVTYDLADWLMMVLGVFAAVVPFLLFFWAIGGIRRWPAARMAGGTLFLGGLSLIAASFMHLLPLGGEGERYFLGGTAGGYVSHRLAGLFGLLGAMVVLGILALLIVVGVTGRTGAATAAQLAASAAGSAGVVRRAASSPLRRAMEGLQGLRREREEEAEPDDLEAEENAAFAGSSRRNGDLFGDEEDGSEEEEEALEEASAAAATGAPAGPAAAAARRPRIVAASQAVGEARRRSAAGARSNGGGGAGGFTRPALDLLEKPEAQKQVPREELLSRSQLLESRLRDFGVECRVVEVHPGPVITRFELEPARGIKVAQIANLADDLALGLRAQSIRILAPIPGKGTVGVEIPNEETSLVRISEVIAAEAFTGASIALPFSLGKDIGGRPRVTALEKMPHLLIAGSTGSGKSVCVNSLLVSLLYACTPDDVRLLMIDPKRLELSPYNGIPHLLNPVVIEPKAAVRILRWAVSQMDWRYRLLAQAGVRDIAGYNERMARQAGKAMAARAAGAEGAHGAGEAAWPSRLPYIVVVVDELADLMLSQPGELEDALARLAQMARAVGIHLVLATQRPSVDVITGVIKANFPSRIAFKVPSRTDSRTILDANGADALLGRGDMLFLEAGKSEAERIHGCLTTGGEVERVCDFWRAQVTGPPAEISFADQTAAEDNGSDDELFREAAKLVITHQQGSASLLQRRLKVGYSRASRLIDMLEAAGVLGPSEGSKAREVLVDAGYLESLER